MNCRRVEQLLSDALEEPLSGVQREAIAAHFRDCPACRRWQEEVLALRFPLRELNQRLQLGGSGVKGKAIDRWLAERGTVASRRQYGFGRVSTGPVVRRFAFGAAAAALFLIVLVFYRWDRALLPGATPNRVAEGLPSNHGKEALHPIISRSRDGYGEKAVVPPSVFPEASHEVHRSRLGPRASRDSRPGRTKRSGPGIDRPQPAVVDDLAVLNSDPAQVVSRWVRLQPDEWEQIEERVRRTIHVRDDFVTIPFPLLASTSERQIAQAVEQYKKEAAIVDPQLAQNVTLQEKAVSFADLCRALQEQSGVRIEAGRTVADEKVTVLVKERPLRALMREVNRLFGFTWLRSGQEGKYRYELVQDLRSQLLEGELRNQDLDQAMLALDRQMQALRPYLGLTPEELRAKAETAPTAELKKRLQELSWMGWAPLQMYFRLSPEQMAELRSGKSLRFRSQPGANELPLPDDLRLGILGAFSASGLRFWQKGGTSGVAPASQVPAGADQYDPKAAPDVVATMALRLTRSELGQVVLDGDAGFSANGGITAGAELARATSPSVSSPDNARVNAALAHDPDLQREVSWRPASSCRGGIDYPQTYSLTEEEAAAARQRMIEAAAKAEREPPPVSTADVLAAIHQASGFDILSDAYMHLYAPAQVSVEHSRLFEALNRVADGMHYHWRKESGWLLFRSASYFNDKLKEVPNRLLERWAASIQTHGHLTLDDLIEIAQLSDPQLDSEVIAQGAVRCHGIKGWGLARNNQRHLRFLALLDSEQRRLVQSQEGLPFRRMNNAQQQQFLAVAFGDSPIPVAPEALPGARLRVALSWPGAFEWVPPAEWAALPSPRYVQAATREQALAAARRLDPKVTIADILPTMADLQIEYTLGPDADGLSRFLLIQQRSGGRNGWRRANDPGR